MDFEDWLNTEEGHNAFLNSLQDGDYEEEIYNNEYKTTTLETIEIKLTSTKYFNSKERYLRAKLINNKLNSSEINLEVMHDKYNNNDPFALEVYLNGIMIGYIQKKDIFDNINKFCFKNGKLIDSLKLEWDNDKLLLSREVPIKEPNLTNDEIMELMTNELKKDDFFKNLKSIWASWDAICKEMSKLIENSDDELYTKQEYRKFVRNHTHLFFDKIKKSTEAKLLEEQKEAEKKRQLEEEKRKEEERKKYLASPEYKEECAKREKEERERKEKQERENKKLFLIILLPFVFIFFLILISSFN